ncbi:hypothetical protein D8674_009860 [Pyrus ussuriensis x Pyrus communis]|uniref:Uncharacterized protein n=1 Tax=Pyrus ussuriensis x Pyrus communis TaxID=2448454 RepID=A0A5N5F955_9ROSA|nr:hypothetical protein D8674_009860 [Pyrus ussuriensis x Pyrus communis]
MGRWKFQKHSERASAKKRRCRGSMLVSGRSSERSGIRRCCFKEGGGREGRVHEVFSCRLDILGGLIEAG